MTDQTPPPPAATLSPSPAADAAAQGVISELCEVADRLYWIRRRSEEIGGDLALAEAISTLASEATDLVEDVIMRLMDAGLDEEFFSTPL